MTFSKKLILFLICCLLPSAFSMGAGGGCSNSAGPPAAPLELPSASGTATEAANTSTGAAAKSTTSALNISALMVDAFFKDESGPECKTNDDCRTLNFYKGEPICNTDLLKCVIQCQTDSDCTVIAQTGACKNISHSTGKGFCESHGESCSSGSIKPSLLECESGSHTMLSCIQEATTGTGRVNEGEAERTGTINNATVVAKLTACKKTDITGVVRTFNGYFRGIMAIGPDILTSTEKNTVAATSSCTTNSQCGGGSQAKCVCNGTDGVLHTFEDGPCAATAGTCSHALPFNDHTQTFNVISFGDSSRMDFTTSNAANSTSSAGTISIDVNSIGHLVNKNQVTGKFTGTVNVNETTLNGATGSRVTDCNPSTENPIKTCTCTGTSCP